jgi:hypothetical protein
MERIVIEVNKTTAKKWRTSTLQQKRKLAAVLQKALKMHEVIVVREPAIGYARPPEEVLGAHYERVQKTLPQYQAFLDRVREKAAAQGLTDEILEELLKTDD